MHQHDRDRAQPRVDRAASEPGAAASSSSGVTHRARPPPTRSSISSTSAASGGGRSIALARRCRAGPDSRSSARRRNPCVIASSSGSPARSSSALVATVVPIRNSQAGSLARRSAAGSPRPPHRRSGRDLRDSSLAVTIRPSGCRATTSVKVPPRSIQKCQPVSAHHAYPFVSSEVEKRYRLRFSTALEANGAGAISGAPCPYAGTAWRDAAPTDAGRASGADRAAPRPPAAAGRPSPRTAGRHPRRSRCA